MYSHLGTKVNKTVEVPLLEVLVLKYMEKRLDSHKPLGSLDFLNALHVQPHASNYLLKCIPGEDREVRNLQHLSNDRVGFSLKLLLYPYRMIKI